jgi:hypothetical protein
MSKSIVDPVNDNAKGALGQMVDGPDVAPAVGVPLQGPGRVVMVTGPVGELIPFASQSANIYMWKDDPEASPVNV